MPHKNPPPPLPSPFWTTTITILLAILAEFFILMFTPIIQELTLGVLTYITKALDPSMDTNHTIFTFQCGDSLLVDLYSQTILYCNAFYQYFLIKVMVLIVGRCRELAIANQGKLHLKHPLPPSIRQLNNPTRIISNERH